MHVVIQTINLIWEWVSVYNSIKFYSEFSKLFLTIYDQVGFPRETWRCHRPTRTTIIRPSQATRSSKTTRPGIMLKDISPTRSITKTRISMQTRIPSIQIRIPSIQIRIPSIQTRIPSMETRIPNIIISINNSNSLRILPIITTNGPRIMEDR